MKLNIYKQLLLIAIIFSCFSSNNVLAQKVRRCATMEAINERLKTDPDFRKDYEDKQKDVAAYLAAHPVTEAFPNGTDTVIIPVVVHIVTSNPYKVTDDNVQFFIDRLNEDYSGFNADSNNAPSFLNVRGHSLMRFALARRDVSGKATTGIERKVVSSSLMIAQTQAQSIKTTSTGGLNAWDVTKYYNIWIGQGFSTTGLLGISPQIGPGVTTGTSADGVCVDEEVFANNPCYSSKEYALARTAVHEIGHNMGLRHTFEGGCSTTSTDFSGNLTTPGKSLPASLLLTADDTPPTSTPNYGTSSNGSCTLSSSGIQNNCTNSAEMMYQNYMDYSDDPCMSLFTNGQVKRMHYVVQNFRAGYLTTKGHLPPDGTPQNEAGATTIVSPGGYEFINCGSVYNALPTCSNNSFIPKLKVTNYGVNVLNTITVNMMVNGSVVATQTFNTSIKPTRNATFALPAQTLPLGSNIVKLFTSYPNGILDSINTNDTLTTTINITNTTPAVTSLPLTEGFEGTAINATATGWTVNNAQLATTTWDTADTRAFKTGSNCATIEFYNYSGAVGDVDYLNSKQLNFNNTSDSVFLSFHYAYRARSTASSALKDTLSIEVTTDCTPLNANWTTLWKKGGNTLRTLTTALATEWTKPVAANWTTTPVKVSLWNYKNQPIYVAFKAKNGGGQNLFLDDISIYSVPAPLPVKLTSFTVQQNTKNITCKWETKLEEGIKNYQVERSINGTNFESIGTVNALGNTTNAAFYQYADENAYKQNAANLYYRLKINDDNGKFSYSNIVVVKIGEKQSVQLYPNPAKEFVNVQITSSAVNSTISTIQIVDYLGRVVLDKKVAVANGTQSFELNTSSLPKANYMVVIKNENEVKTLKFVKE